MWTPGRLKALVASASVGSDWQTCASDVSQSEGGVVTPIQCCAKFVDLDPAHVKDIVKSEPVLKPPSVSVVVDDGKAALDALVAARLDRLEDRVARLSDLERQLADDQAAQTVERARLAAEWAGGGDGGDAALGGLVGYAVRGESRRRGETPLEYVTTGALLRRLQEPGALARYTHVVVDEVHERSSDVDLLLLVLKRAVGRGAAPRVVLMSATVDVGPLRAYFGGAAALDVPGRTFPVDVRYVEDAVGALANFYVAPGDAGAREKPLPDAPSETPAASHRRPTCARAFERSFASWSSTRWTAHPFFS